MYIYIYIPYIQPYIHTLYSIIRGHQHRPVSPSVQADRDGDGLINPDEFYRVMRKPPGQNRSVPW